MVVQKTAGCKSAGNSDKETCTFQNNLKIDEMNLGIFQKWLDIQTHADYEGQKLAERIFHAIILLFGIAGFAWGYYIQQFGAVVIILFAGCIVSSLLVLPPWPIYRRNPLEWQKPRNPEKSTERTESKNKKKQKSN